MINVRHDTPGRRCLRNRSLQGKMQFWARGFMVCVNNHEDLRKEMLDWPDGLILLMDILGDEPKIAFQKYSDRLHSIDPSALINYDIRLSFKNISITRRILSGRMGFYRAVYENRLVVQGPSGYCASLMRCLIKAQDMLFRLPKEEVLPERKRFRLYERLKIYKDILFMRHKGKESAFVDTQVLRVFE